ncbi:MAG: hypothetical protein HY327_04455 [Chloroflexi bacterium]|nr:hypothetical protein [Chloroflexota bacterium]
MNPLELLPYLKAHRSFALGSSIALALLYAEEGWATFTFWSNRPVNEATNLIVALIVITFAGYLISFLLPPQMVNASWKYPRAWGVFIRVAAMSFALVIATNVAAFAILLILAGGNLVAVYNLLRDVYLYTLVGILIFHGLLLYVRYLRYIYHAFGAPPPSKVIGASAGIAVLIVLIVGFLFAIDLHSLDTAPLAQQGVVGLHVYGRALYLLTVMLAAFGWHLRWVGDH